jgi:outer membrane usher protein
MPKDRCKSFKYGNPVLPGDYNVDIYVNGNGLVTRMVFKATENNQNAFTCFSSNQLLEYGVKADVLKKAKALL